MLALELIVSCLVMGLAVCIGASSLGLAFGCAVRAFEWVQSW